MGGYEAGVRALIEAGVDPNVASNGGRTPLYWAVWNGHEACVAALISAGVDPNAVNDDGHTPLIWATWNGREACVMALIAAGADLNVASNDGWTPLHRAARGGHESCIMTLIAAGADPDIIDNCGRTPLHRTVEKGNKECTKILVECILADRALTDYEWDLMSPDSDIGHLLPVVMTRDGRDAAAKLVSKLPEEKRKVLQTAAMCLSHFVHHDVAEQILVRCV